MKNNTLVILGMHRSGTSLTAKWLHSSGLNLGKELLGKNFSNPTGHYEDLDFYDFHEAILKRNNKNYLIGENVDLELNEHDYKKAASIVQLKNKLYKQWGWKEPRTCLFYSEIWNKLLQNGNVLIIYRNPYDVVNSIYRRERKRILETINSKSSFKGMLKIPFHVITLLRFYYNRNKFEKVCLSSWIRYNEDLIKVTKAIDKSKLLVVSIQDVINNDKKIFNHIVVKWKFNLSYQPIANIFKANMYKSGVLKNNIENEKIDKILYELDKIRKPFS